MASHQHRDSPPALVEATAAGAAALPGARQPRASLAASLFIGVLHRSGPCAFLWLQREEAAEFFNRTTAGGVITVVSSLLMAVLFLSELRECGCSCGCR